MGGLSDHALDNGGRFGGGVWVNWFFWGLRAWRAILAPVAPEEVRAFRINPLAAGALSFCLTPSKAGIREHIGKAEQAQLQHHAGGEQGRRLCAQDFLKEFPIAHVRIELKLILSRPVKVRYEADEACQNKQHHHRLYGAAARLIAPPELPEQRGQGRHDQYQGYELRGLFVMLQQHQLGHGAQEPEHQNADNPTAQQLDAIGSDAVGACLRWLRVHRSLLYGRLRASFINSVTVTLYFAITPLTNAVASATSGFSGISAFSISIMPFSIAT